MFIKIVLLIITLVIYVLYFIIDQKPEHKPPSLPHNPTLAVTWATAVHSSQQWSPEQARGFGHSPRLQAFIPMAPRPGQLKTRTERAVCICVCEVSTPGGWHYDRVKGHRFLGGFSHYILLKVTMEKQFERCPSFPAIFPFLYEAYKTLFLQKTV